MFLSVLEERTSKSGRKGGMVETFTFILVSFYWVMVT
jgi:hypothetical protein